MQSPVIFLPWPMVQVSCSTRRRCTSDLHPRGITYTCCMEWTLLHDGIANCILKWTWAGHHPLVLMLRIFWHVNWPSDQWSAGFLNRSLAFQNMSQFSYTYFLSRPAAEYATLKAWWEFDQTISSLPLLSLHLYSLQYPANCCSQLSGASLACETSLIWGGWQIDPDR